MAVPAPALAEEAPAKGEKAEKDPKDGKAEKGDKKEKKKNAEHKITQSESFLGLDPLYTSIMDGNRPLGLLMVGIGLDIPDKELRERTDREMPKLRDAYVRALISYTATHVRSWRQPDVASLADRLQQVTDRVLGKKDAARVLLGQVAIQLNN